MKKIRFLVAALIVLCLFGGTMACASAPAAQKGGATATISSPSNGALFEAGTSVSFDGSKSTGSGNLNTTYPVVSWDWSFGDGDSGSGSTVSHSYAKAGSYTVTLTVTDSVKVTATASIDLCISPLAQPQNLPSQPTGGAGFNPALGGMVLLNLGGATAVITSPSGGALYETGAAVSFDGSKSTGSGNLNTTYPVVSWIWDFGDGDSGSGSAASHGYAKGGCYVATLTVTDSVGQSASASVLVYVSPQALPQYLPSQPNGGANFNLALGGSALMMLAGPTAVIGPPSNGALFETGAAASFDGSKSTGTSSGNITLPIISWDWDFGDGGSASGATVNHTYASAGSYTVTLTVTDSRGMTASASITVCVSPPARPQSIPSQPGGESSFNPVSGGMTFI